MSRPALMPVEEALARVLASIPGPLGAEKVALADAFGRTLAHDVARAANPAAVRQFGDGRLRAARRRRGARRRRI